MKKLLPFLIFSLTFFQLPAQSWQELYDSTDECWESDWKVCAEVLEKALVAARQEFGEQDSNYAKTLVALGASYIGTGEYPQALSYLDPGLKAVEQFLGKNHLLYANSLYDLARLYRLMGQYDKALPRYQESLAHVERLKGKEHPEYANLKNSLGMLYMNMGNYSEALQYLLEATELMKKSVGDSDMNYAGVLNGLGLVYWKMGEHESALSTYYKASEIVEAQLGKNHPFYSILLNNIGLVYQNMTRYEEALPLFLDMVSLAKEQLGEDHPEYGTRINNLGLLYKKMGQYEKALPLFQQALNNTAQNLGVQHPLYGSKLNALGNMYKEMGNYKDALRLLQESLDHARQTLGEAHPLYGIRVNNLAGVYLGMGEYQTALPLLQEALVLAGKNPGKDHYAYGIRLVNLGQVYSKLGEYKKADSLLKEALINVDKTLGQQHANYGNTLGALGKLYVSMGEYEEARAYLEKASKHTKKYLGSQHNRYPIELSSLGLTYENLGLVDSADLVYQELFEVLSYQLTTQFSTLNERLQTSFLNQKADIFAQISSFSYSHPEKTDFYKISFNQQLLLKGFLQEQQVQFLSAMNNKESLNSEQDYLEWKQLHKILARQYQKAISDRILGLDSIEQRIGELETKLSNQFLEFRQIYAQVAWKDVQKVLKPQEAVIEFANFPFYKNGKKTDSSVYVAFILTAEDSLPQMVSLFEENELAQIFDSNEARYLAYNYRGIKPRKKQFQKNEQLYPLIWEPIEEYLTDVKTIYFAPSGIIHTINLHAIPITEKKLLADKYKLIQLGSTRRLVFDKEDIKIDDSLTALLLGGIDYDHDRLDSVPSLANVEAELEISELENIHINSRGNIAKWQYLSGTAEEIKNINQLLTQKGYLVSLKEGMNATETFIKKQKSSPHVLHIATHGYFFPAIQDTTNTINKEELTPIQLSEHPMVRSGLVLAGANHAWQGNTVPEGQEDGILTAYEISQMNLSNTELVVLSACETGLGDIEGNEGVYGLQRAFKIAGARYLIMSLWQVPDKETMEFMTTFYQNWLEGEMEIPEAFRATQKNMRKKYEEPYKWAGFVLVE